MHSPTIGVVPLPWTKGQNNRFWAYTLFGRVELKPTLEPWTASKPFSKPITGWGIFLKDKRVGWVRDLPDAAHYATAHITQLFNKQRGLK